MSGDYGCVVTNLTIGVSRRNLFKIEGEKERRQETRKRRERVREEKAMAREIKWEAAKKERAAKRAAKLAAETARLAAEKRAEKARKKQANAQIKACVRGEIPPKSTKGKKTGDGVKADGKKKRKRDAQDESGRGGDNVKKKRARKGEDGK